MTGEHLNGAQEKNSKCPLSLLFHSSFSRPQHSPGSKARGGQDFVAVPGSTPHPGSRAAMLRALFSQVEACETVEVQIDAAFTNRQ